MRTKAHAGQGIICRPVPGSGEPLSYLGGCLPALFAITQYVVFGKKSTRIWGQKGIYYTTYKHNISVVLQRLCLIIAVLHVQFARCALLVFAKMRKVETFDRS